MGKYIHKQHNVSVLLYHVVLPAKYRKIIFTKTVDEVLKNICLEISQRYEIHFIEIGTDKNHVHFLLQTVPKISPTRLVMLIKSITAKEMFHQCPEIKKQLWGGSLWTSGYYINTVGQHGNEDTIRNYVKNQGKENDYEIIHKEPLILLSLFDS